ncbi:MAG: DUF4194 domain-containing protein, partial [Verrucomicrobia bacterium]|nr:DUF4194 domain-containing protein [Verrucomicrobiota bacterium]
MQTRPGLSRLPPSKSGCYKTRYHPNIENYFQEIGLNLVVHEEDGFAYLKQADMEDGGGIPRLFRRDKLTKGVAIVGVVLRERLLQFDEKIHDESRLVLR